VPHSSFAILGSLAAALKTIDRDSAAVLVQFVDSCLRVKACTGLEQLEVWARRAVRVTDAAELFVEG
jgi:hypothetical protein